MYATTYILDMNNDAHTDRTAEIIARQNALKLAAEKLMNKNVTLETAIAAIACGKPSQLQEDAVTWLRNR